MGALSPNGPRGPRESSIASNLVGCASTRRGVRGVLGPRPTGERGAEDAESEEGGGLFLDGDSAILLEDYLWYLSYLYLALLIRQHWEDCCASLIARVHLIR